MIGRRASRVPLGEALDHVLGLTCLNDVTARELQRKDVQYTRGKGFDTFAPDRSVHRDWPGSVGARYRRLGERRQAAGVEHAGS